MIWLLGSVGSALTALTGVLVTRRNVAKARAQRTQLVEW